MFHSGGKFCDSERLYQSLCDCFYDQDWSWVQSLLMMALVGSIGGLSTIQLFST